jgi:hypothetical protein
MKRYAVFFLVIVMHGAMAYAQTTVNGDEVNSKLERFFWNVTNLIPGTVTQQGVWSRAAIKWGLGGTIGFGASDMERAVNILRGTFSDGASFEMDALPENVPLTPAIGADFRFGILERQLPDILAMDFGLSFMYFNSTWVDWNWNMFDFTIFTLGGDARFAVLLHALELSLGAGYIFTTNKYVFEPSGPSADFNFLTDVIMVNFQADFAAMSDLLTPFIGFKAVFAGTSIDYNWGTNQNVSFGGKEVGSNYAYSSTRQGEMLLYPQLYGGFGVLGNLITLGASYDFAAKNFGAHISVRFASSHPW